jgi:hypothetical protein
VELSDEEIEEIKSEMGVQPWEEGHIAQIPAIITCECCGTSFESCDYGEEGDEDEDM